MSKYDNILEMSFNLKHERMSIANRSFQFAPFSALSGYSDLIKEKGRITEGKCDLDDDKKVLLNQKLKIINEYLAFKPEVTITYFEPDVKKDGGIYEKISSQIKKIDFIKQIIILENKLMIKCDDIINIECDELSFDE